MSRTVTRPPRQTVRDVPPFTWRGPGATGAATVCGASSAARDAGILPSLIDHAARAPLTSTVPSGHRSCLGEPFFEVVGVEAYIVSEAVVWDLASTGLGQQPGVRYSEQPACGLRVDQGRELCIGHAAPSGPQPGRACAQSLGGT